VIPLAYITEWRENAPWQAEAQVEQDLIISRALVEIFNNELLSAHLAFRGGTALHKLCFQPPPRYSEDIDLVQVEPGNTIAIVDALEQSIEHWLNPARRLKLGGNHVLVFGFESESQPVQPMSLKIDLTTGEDFSVLGIRNQEYSVHSTWFDGSTYLKTYDVNELLATKLRALLTRRQGRDLFDLWLALSRGGVNAGEIVRVFIEYMGRSNLQVSGNEFQDNLAAKLNDTGFRGDILPLLRPAVADAYDVDEAGAIVNEQLLSLIP
jgi:predicted nucleotidyltransferase component of viral defense system